MAKTSISVANPPDYIYVGETLGININTDGDITYMAMNPTGIISINEARDKITGIAAGTVEFTVKAQRLGYEESTLIVNLRCIERTSRTTGFMLHNRSSNRVSFVQAQDTANPTDLLIKLPKYNGDSTLVTKEALLNKFNMIITPTIVNPSNGDTDVEGWISGSNYQTQLGFQGAHEASVWEYASDINFENILDTVYVNRAEDKTKGPVIHSLSTVYVRVKYVSGTVESGWSDPIMITTKNVGRDSKTTLIKGDAITGGYFGIVPHSECIGDRNYRGNWVTLEANNLKKFYKGWQVHKGDTLYYALRDITAAECKDPEISAPTGDGQWSYDNREALPTPEWVNGVTGIGFGFTDNNGDGYSTGSTSVGAIQDHELGWIKYAYKGKICYTPVKPICTTICWNDIAKRDIMYGERTFRGGATQMYRIRLMREDEYTTIIPGLMDGTLANYTQLELGLIDDKVNTKARLTWLEDFQEGSRRKVGDHTGKKIYEVDPKSRVGTLSLIDGVTAWQMSYRPVIELVTESGEPWRNWPLCTEADDEEFQYDKYTDTGYFGRVRSDVFIRGDDLATTIGMTGGYSWKPETGWFKFYWHGIVLYIGQMVYRYCINPVTVRTIGATSAFDTGDKLVKRITLNGVDYMVGITTGARYDPVVTSNYYSDDKVEPGSYSHLSELLYRVYTNNIENYYKTETGYKIGPQKGDNWDTFNVDTNYGVNGDGPDTAANPVNSYYIVMEFNYNSWSYGTASIEAHIGRAGILGLLKYTTSNHIWLTRDLEGGGRQTLPNQTRRYQ